MVGWQIFFSYPEFQVLAIWNALTNEKNNMHEKLLKRVVSLIRELRNSRDSDQNWPQLKALVEANAETILNTFTQDWKVYPLPDILSLDNGFGFTAAGRGKWYISGFIQCMLRLGVTPLFIAPKKPWMNGSVEGTHSVFARKVWNKFDFKNLEEVDETVARFQEAYRQYAKTPNVFPGRTLDEDFNWQDIFHTPFEPQDGMCIYLIRLVQEYQKDQSQIPAIRLFKELVELDKYFINTYVLVKMDVYREHIFIYVEPDQDGQKLVMEKALPLHFAKMRY